MDDTPRTDWLLEEWDYSPPPKVMEAHAKELERDLEAANKRIRRLENAGDRLDWLAMQIGWTIDELKTVSEIRTHWAKAKEANP